MSIEPLPMELKALIDTEPSPSPSPELEARLLARLDASIDVAALEPLPSAGAAPGPLAAKLGLGGLIFAAGVVTGALIHAQLTQPLVMTPALAPPVEQPAKVLPPAPAPEPAAEPAVEPKPLPAPVRPAVKRPPTIPSASTLEAERRLLEPARTALARKMAAQSLGLIQKHAEEFPAGELAEEREALWVQALSASGDLAGARAKAVAFKVRFPDSMFVPVVERAAGP